MFKIVIPSSKLVSSVQTLSHLTRRTMASASRVELAVGQWPSFYLPGITQEQARIASELLQENHDRYHVFFNSSGFHNHIAHHLLTVYALAASPAEIKRQYKVNQGYQRLQRAVDDGVVSKLHNPAQFSSHLGKERHYHDFVVFFQNEINETSWQSVINKYLLARNDQADDLLARLYAGFLHPLIHLGFGVEFQQPAIIAEALAQAAVHDTWTRKLYFPAEEAVKEYRSKPSKSIVELLDAIQADPVIKAAPKWSDGNKLRDGTLGRAGDKMISYVSRYHVKPEEVKEKTAEMSNAVIYYTAGAQRKDKRIKFDFYFIHCVNSSIFFDAFLKQDWLRDADKARLLEWKVWTDLAMYASRKNPPILLDEIRNYKPRHPSGWDEIFERVRGLDDDGHASKLVRAVASAERASAPYEHKDNFRIKGDDWLKIGHMAIDSVEGGSEATWVRSAGFDEAWKDVSARAQL